MRVVSATKMKLFNIFFQLPCSIVCFMVVWNSFWFTSTNKLSWFFGPWLQQVDGNLHSQVCLRASAIIWSIWLSRNDLIFWQKGVVFLFTGCFQGYTLDMLMVHLTKDHDRPLLKWASRLETTTMEMTTTKMISQDTTQPLMQVDIKCNRLLKYLRIYAGRHIIYAGGQKLPAS
jgi:hypothetical protein